MKTTIQIIDDNVALTTLLAKTLRKFGYDPVVENNPLLAINSARHHLPDLILLDVMMPERDGGRVLADLRSDLSLRYIPVILLTAIAREAQALADTGGINSMILSKPVQLKELMSAIESQLSHTPTDIVNGETPAQIESNSSTQLPDFSSLPESPDPETPIIDIPSRDSGDFVNPGAEANGSFGGNSPTPNFSFPDHPGSTDGPAENPW